MSTETTNDLFDFDKNTKYHIENLLKECVENLNNIDEFVEKVNNDLASDEMKNIYLLKNFKSMHKDLEKEIDNCMNIIEKYEQRIYSFEKSLVNIRSNFDELEMFSVWEQKQKNQIELFNELSNIMNILDIDRNEMDIFFKFDNKVLPIQMKAFVLKLVEVSRRNLPPGVCLIVGVKTQLNKVDQIIIEFCDRFAIFIHQLIANLFSVNKSSDILIDIKNIHRSLNIYAPIMICLKSLNLSKFSQIYTSYCQEFYIYHKERFNQYILSIISKIEIFDITKYKIDSPSPLYREIDDIKNRDQKVSKIIIDILTLINSLTIETAEYSDIFFSFSSSSEQPTLKDNSSSTVEPRKRGGASVKLKALLNSIFEFLDASLRNFIEELSKADSYYLLTALHTLNSDKVNIANENDFYDKVLNQLNKSFSESLKIFILQVTQTLDVKKSRRNQLADMIKSYKDFLTICVNILPNKYQEDPLLTNFYRDILKKIINVIDNSFLDAGEKQSREVYMIENLYNLHACLPDLQIRALREERKNIKVLYTSEIDSFIKNAIITPYAKLLSFIDEIDNKIAGNVTESNIQAHVYNNRNEYKKSIKDFNFKNIKKNVERVHKLVKKQFTDISLFVTVWNLMAAQIIFQINKIFLYVQKYCVRIPDMCLEFTVEDVFNLIKTLDE